MKYSLILGLLLLSFNFGCSGSGPGAEYTLEDTWGENGNWGESGSEVAEKPPVNTPEKTEKPTEDKKVEVPVEDTKVAEETEKPVEETKVAEEDSEPPVEESTEPLPEFKSDRYHYTLKNLAGWSEKGSVGNLEANFVKEVEDNSLIFSVGVIKNGKSITPEFKKMYLEKLATSFIALNVASDSEETINGIKSWSIDYTFEKEGNKLQQKQTFIPYKNNILVLNKISSEDSFFAIGDQFNEISASLTLN